MTTFSKCVILTALLIGSGASQATEILRQEPGPGTLVPGQVVLVDDGTCSRGRLKEVRGGANVGSGIHATTAKRTKRCVAR